MGRWLSAALAIAAAENALDRQLSELLKRVPNREMENCVLSHLYMLRWDNWGNPSAYGLRAQRDCLGTDTDHKRDRKLSWAKKTVQRVREAGAAYGEVTANPLVPINQRLVATAGFWWADDYFVWVNALFGGDKPECIAQIFVYTANESQPCQILVPALFEYDLAQEQVYRLRRSEIVTLPWISRRPQVFYRGKDFAPESCAHFFPTNYRPRRKLELLSRRYPEVINASTHKNDAVDLVYFARYRYVMDIGGVSCTTWSALHWKLSSGSLVLVVDHPGGLANWWMRYKLRPWVHYVPIKPDYSDLFDIIKYFEYHVDEAVAIAARGQQAALRYTQNDAYDALGRVLLESTTDNPPALHAYDSRPPRDTWYCAIGNDADCEVRYY